MRLRSLFGPVMVLFVALAAGQYPPLSQVPNGTSRPEPEHRLPMDQPEEVQSHASKPKVGAAELRREASELANLAGQVPPAVEQASNGVLSRDLSDRLKRIEKLSRQLRRELFQ